MCTVNEDTQGYGSGCQVPVGNGICGETNTLGIIEQFKRLYEDKMRQIDAEAGGDYMQEKINLQQEWISDLTEQNVMLVRAVEELEYEATQRVQMLEEKLQHSAQCICEVMKKYREHDITSDLLAEPLQKIAHLESDVKNLIEFIRRVRENDDWSIDGLVFYQVDYKDILGPAGVLEKCKQKCGNKNNLLLPDPDEGEKLLNEKDRQVRDLQGRVDYFNSFGNIEEICKELNCRKLECENLKQEMGEVRQALTEEVAHKHDQIMQLKRDVQDLEDRCIQADKQTAFRDEIIKELKKEIKQLKQQNLPEKLQKPSTPPKSQTTQPSQPKYDNDGPYLIINHTHKKETGKNTVIFIHKDGTVEKETRVLNDDKKFNSVFEEHRDTCLKCKEKVESQLSSNNNANALYNCKSETDLANAKSMLRPVKERSVLTATGITRCKTFLDKPRLAWKGQSSCCDRDRR